MSAKQAEQRCDSEDFSSGSTEVVNVKAKKKAATCGYVYVLQSSSSQYTIKWM